jgi:hypothetical protein
LRGGLESSHCSCGKSSFHCCKLGEIALSVWREQEEIIIWEPSMPKKKGKNFGEFNEVFMGKGMNEIDFETFPFISLLGLYP